MTALDSLKRPEVGQVVLPATPGGSPAAREWQVNVPLTRNNDLPYGFFWRPPILSGTRSTRVKSGALVLRGIADILTRLWPLVPGGWITMPSLVMVCSRRALWLSGSG